MAVLKDDTSKRRRSIAVPNQNTQTITAQGGRRRAHSIVPGERLNGLDKLRRSSFAPRGIILKTSSLVNTEDGSERLSQPVNSQPDDGSITQPMDFTVDYRAPVHDNTSRKSLGRRVSFATHAHVRLFEKPNHDNTNSTGSPQSSPIPSSSPEMDPQPTLSNENDYPASFSRRRSSVRHSIAGSEDMDLTTASPGALFVGEEGSALMDQEMEFDENADMDITEVLPGDILRRRSLAGRRPFATVQPRESIVFPSDDAIPSDDDDDDDVNQTRSTVEDNSQVHSEAGHDQEGMEFTVLTGQSLRPPPSEDPVWLALRKMTHSGDSPHEPEASEDSIRISDGQQGMNLDDAMARLMRVRDSMGASADNTATDMDLTTTGANMAQEDSFLSTDDSLNDDVIAGDGNETLNVSRVIGRLSLGTDLRASLGYQDSMMDESSIYGFAQPLPSSTPRPSIITSQQIEEREDPQTEPQGRNGSVARPTVFQAPIQNTVLPSSTPAAANTVEKQSMTAPVFVPPSASPAVLQTTRSPTKPTSPVKNKPRPTFSAAFAPPVTKPSPKKLSTTSTPVHATGNKRPFSAMQDNDHTPGRPAKRSKPTEGPSAGTPKKGPTPSQSRMSLSPNKGPAVNGMSALPATAKRQSGYFARRKSLGSALAAPRNDRSRSTSPVRRVSNGRASLDSVQPEGVARFDKNEALPSIPTISPLIEIPREESHPEPVPQHARIPSPIPARASPVSLVSNPTAQPLSWIPDQPDPQPLNNHQVPGELVSDQLDTQVEEDVPSTSIREFFSMTGIKFMDELTAPRRSVHPHTRSRQARSAAEIALSEYYIAMGIDVPQLGLFTRVSKDLDGWITRSKADFTQAESEAAKITPELFVEFMRADEEGQAELMHQLNLIRVNARGQAKSDWYDWKLRWVQGLQTTAEQAFHDLQADAKILEPIKSAAEELVPNLRTEYNDILKVLEREQAEVADIEACDQEYLNDLKLSIAEQNIEVEALRAELSEHTEQLNYFEGRLEELAITKKEANEAITKAKHILQMKENSTSAEVFRLRDELETLEDLHRFRITRVDQNIFEYVYASHFKVSIPCRQYLPVVSGVEIAHVDGPTLRKKDDFPKLSNILLRAGKSLVHHSQLKSCKEVIHEVSDYWSSCSQMRAQLHLLAIKYPIDILPLDCDGIPGFRARTKVIIPSKKAKIFVTFNFTPEVFSRWPLSLNSLTFDVEVSYGPIDHAMVEQALSGRLCQATPSDNYACLLDACIEAQEIYN